MKSIFKKMGFMGMMSLVGYVQPIYGGLKEDTDSIVKNMKIREVVVEGKRVLQYPDKDVWIITKEMRKNAFNTKEMIGNIPGMYYDRFTGELSYNGQTKIKILMDGKDKPASYVENLVHLRFKQVEITPNPQGLYRDYDVLINVITKENYEGIEGLTNVSGKLSPSQEDPKSQVAPNFTLTYTRNKVNLAVHYDYEYSLQQQDWMEIRRVYPDYHLQTFKGKNPVEANRFIGHGTWIDGDYDINKNHSVSFRYTYSNRNPRTLNDFMVEKQYKNPDMESTFRREQTWTRNPNEEHVGTLYYRGQVKDWKLYGDFTYNYYVSDNDYRFDEEQGEQIYTAFHNQKHYTRLALDVTRTIKQKTTFNMGYSNTYKKYKSNDGVSLSSSDEYRNRFYTSLYHTFNERLNGGVSGNVEYIQNKFNGGKEKQWVWSLNANMRYRFKKSGYSMNWGYNCQTNYPNQFQTNPIGYRTGYDVWIVGNPALKPDMSHRVNFNIFLWKFSVWGGFNYAGNSITSLITQNEYDGIVQSYYNIKRMNPYCGVRFNNQNEIKEGMILSYGCNVNYNYSRYKFEEADVDAKGGNWFGSFNLGLHMETAKGYRGFTLGYNDNGYGKAISPQGYIEDRMKSFNFKILANFFSDRFQMSLYYRYPLQDGKYNMYYSENVTPYYQTYFSFDQSERLKHEVSLTVSWRFAYGRQVKKKHNSQTVEAENNNLLR